MLVYDTSASVTRRVIVVYCEADSLVFKLFVSKSVMSFNGLSFASARHAPQPCVSVLVVQGIQEMRATEVTIYIYFFLFHTVEPP